MSKKKKDGIDEKQLEICKQRGHDTGYLGTDWSQCKWCRMFATRFRWSATVCFSTPCVLMRRAGRIGSSASQLCQWMDRLDALTCV